MGYAPNTPITDQLSVSYNEGIYNKSTSESWWIASPSNSSPDIGIKVQAEIGGFNDAMLEMEAYAVRPIVCIPTSVFNSNYANSLV